MSPEEIYAELRSVLEEMQLSWIIEEVENQMRIGRLDTRDVHTLSLPEDHARQQRLPLLGQGSENNLRRGRTATFPVSVEFSPRERVEILLNAIEQVFVNTIEIQDVALESLWQKNVDNTVEFYNENDDKPTLVISRELLKNKLAVAEHLHSLLDQLRRNL